ncbi:MAG: hypothetical protein Kow0099_01080 [Candidatus Abyssubacteria bacterium]
MRTGFGQLICLIAGVFLLSLGSGLAGARWAIHRHALTESGEIHEKSASSPESPDQTRLPSIDTVATPGNEQSSRTPPEQIPDPLRNPIVPPPVTGKSEAEPSPPSSESVPQPELQSEFVIQAISTSKREEAITARNTFINQGFPAGIFEVDLGDKGKWYRVYVGPYDSEADARADLESVRQVPGFKASFVKSLD